MPPSFNVFKVFGGSKRPADNAYAPYAGGPAPATALSGRRVLRRRDTRGAHQQPPQIAHPPTLTAISEDDMSRYSRYPTFSEHHDHPPIVANNVAHGMPLGNEVGQLEPPHEIHASIEPEPRPRGVQLVDTPIQIHPHPHLHEEFTEFSDDERSDVTDERHDEPRNYSPPRSRSHSSRSPSRGGHWAPYMGRAPTPYHPPEASVAESRPSDIRIRPEHPPEETLMSERALPVAPTSGRPIARQPTSEYVPRAHVDRIPSSSRQPTNEQAPRHQYRAHGPSLQRSQPTRVSSNSSHRRDHATPQKHRHDPSGPPPLGIDANTYCYIVPRGTNVIFQDEDGYEITRTGQFQRPPNRSEDTLNYKSPTRKRTVPIIVQDEFGQELYRTGSITHGINDESAYRRTERQHSSSHRGRSRSMSNFANHGPQSGFLPYPHTGPNIVLVDHSGRQIPIATNPHRTTREVQSEHYY